MITPSSSNVYFCPDIRFCKDTNSSNSSASDGMNKYVLCFFSPLAPQHASIVDSWLSIAAFVVDSLRTLSKTSCFSSSVSASASVILTWYVWMKLYCLSPIVMMESFTPNPTSSNPIQPPMPSTVINKRFLYRNRFLTAALLEKLRCFHINVILSRKTRFPILGAAGLINSAGAARSSL